MPKRPLANPVAFALDVSSTDAADHFVRLLAPYVGAFKIGLELFIAAQRSGWWPRTDKDIILDLKLHDTPETVERAIEAAGGLGVKYLTLHVQQRATLVAALRAATQHNITLLGVTVLTSMESNDLHDLDMRGSTFDRALKLTKFASTWGLHGVVCSPHEVGKIKGYYPDLFYLVPGIRQVGSNRGDQKRIGTPSQAIQDGADMIVLGRQVRDSKDPVTETKAVKTELGLEYI